MTKQKQMTERGFTLIELMIAVATTGVLAAIAIPQYQNYVAKSQVAEALSLASGTKTAVAEHYMTTESFPDDNEAARLATTITGKYVTSVTVAGEKITAKFKSDINENIKDRSLVLTATDEDGAITFDCTTDLSEPYAPTGCKTDPYVAGPKAWDPKTSASEGKSACWSQEYADGTGGGNGWVEGETNPRTTYKWRAGRVGEGNMRRCKNFFRYLANEQLTKYRSTGSTIGASGKRIHLHNARNNYGCKLYDNNVYNYTTLLHYDAPCK